MPRMRPTRALAATTKDRVSTAAVNRKHSSTVVGAMDRAMLENIKLKPKITKATQAVITATVCLREGDIWHNLSVGYLLSDGSSGHAASAFFTR